MRFFEQTRMNANLVLMIVMKFRQHAVTLMEVLNVPAKLNSIQFLM